MYIYHHCVTSNPQSYFKIVIKVEIPFRQPRAIREDWTVSLCTLWHSRFSKFFSRQNGRYFTFLTTSLSSHNELNKLDTRLEASFAFGLEGEEDVSPFVVVADKTIATFCDDV